MKQPKTIDAKKITELRDFLANNRVVFYRGQTERPLQSDTTRATFAGKLEATEFVVEYLDEILAGER